MSVHSYDEQRRVAPGIARAMRDVRNASTLSQHPRRHRWNLPRDREQPTEEPAADER